MREVLQSQMKGRFDKSDVGEEVKQGPRHTLVMVAQNSFDPLH